MIGLIIRVVEEWNKCGSHLVNVKCWIPLRRGGGGMKKRREGVLITVAIIYSSDNKPPLITESFHLTLTDSLEKEMAEKIVKRKFRG